MYVAAQSYTVRNVVDGCIIIVVMCVHPITGEPADFFLGDEVNTIASCISIP